MCALFLLGGCEAPRAKEERTRTSDLAKLTSAAKQSLKRGDADRAVALFEKAIALSPADPSLYTGLADAHVAGGNDAAGILALKRAEEISPNLDPTLVRARVDLFKKLKQTNSALLELGRLAKDELLTDAEILEFARMLSRSGQEAAAKMALAPLLTRDPPIVDARVAEVELLLRARHYKAAETAMKELEERHPGTVSLRVLIADDAVRRGRRLAEAERALSGLLPADEERIEVVKMRALVLSERGHAEEQRAYLERLRENRPDDLELLALHAEVLADLGRHTDAAALVQRVLSKDATHALSLTVRGRIELAEGKPEGALDDFRAALVSDPENSLALEQLWRAFQKAGRPAEAMETLEKLERLRDLDANEMASLAELYLESAIEPAKARRLITAALRVSPREKRFLELRARLGKVQRRAQRGLTITR
jgi:tetratricopeptide (TPR) repeat protein